MKTVSYFRKNTFVILLSTLLFVFFISCSKSENQTTEESQVTMDYAAAPPSREAAQSKTIAEQPVPQFEQKIIKNAAMRFQVADYPNSLKTIQHLLKNYGAYLVSSNEMRVDNSLENNLTIRVPSKNLDALTEKLAEQSIYLDYKTISSEDVTTEFVDISARIKTKKAVEQRYLDLLKQAKNVKDIIEVENQLRQIREEIESTQARINYINQQVSYSTITLQIYENNARQTGDQNFLVRILNALRTGWDLFLSGVVGLLYIWPFLLLLVIVLFLARKFFRKYPPIR